MKIRRYIARVLGASGWYGGRGFNQYEKRDYDKAIQFFEKAIAIDPEAGANWLVLSYLGRSHLANGNSSRALPILKKSYEGIGATDLDHSKPFTQGAVSETLSALSFAYLKVGDAENAARIKSIGQTYKEQGSLTRRCS
jgi:tetratricopeptide (TPR) repeat protein